MAALLSSAWQEVLEILDGTAVPVGDMGESGLVLRIISPTCRLAGAEVDEGL